MLIGPERWEIEKITREETDKIESNFNQKIYRLERELLEKESEILQLKSNIDSMEREMYYVKERLDRLEDRDPEEY